MAINRHEKFENHMDVSSAEMSINAEKIETFSEEDSHADPFTIKLDSIGHVPKKPSIAAILDKGKKENGVALEATAHKKKELDSPNGIEAGRQGRDHNEAQDVQDTKTLIDGKVQGIAQQELPDSVKATFKNGEYRTVQTKEDLVLYRVYGYGAGKQGCYLTTVRPEDRWETKMSSALPTKVETNAHGNETSRWNNSREFYCEVYVPKGTILNIGKVEQQRTTGGQILPGKADQVLVSKEFAADPQYYGKEFRLGAAGSYKEFEKKAREIENGQE